MTVQSRRWSRGQRPVERQLADLENLLGRTPMFFAVRSVTAATTIVDSDDLVLVDATSGAVTVTLPLAAVNAGRRFTVKKTDASGNAATIDGNGSETIDGATTAATTTQYVAITVQSDGTAWWVVARGS